MTPEPSSSPLTSVALAVAAARVRESTERLAGVAVLREEQRLISERSALLARESRVLLSASDARWRRGGT